MAPPSPIFFQITQLGPSTQIHKRKVHAFEVKTEDLRTVGDGGARISPGQGFD